jgi:hypothetical protein
MLLLDEGEPELGRFDFEESEVLLEVFAEPGLEDWVEPELENWSEPRLED